MIVAKHQVFRKSVMGCVFASLLTSCSLSHATTEGTVTEQSQDAILQETAPQEVVSQERMAFVQQTREQIQNLLPGELSPLYISILSELYSDNKMKAMWQDAQATKEFEQQLVELALAGFQPQFNHWVKQLTNPAITGMARDVVLSDAMLGYLHFLDGVATQGERWLYQSKAYKPEIPASESIVQWQSAIKDRDLQKFINTLTPQNADYPVMRSAMLAFLKDEKEWPTIAFKKTIKVGNALTANDMAALEEILNRTATWSKDATLQVTLDETQAKKYDKSLVEAVKAFQTLHGLANDGSIGKQTVAWLNVTPKERATLMALNIQRLRLIPTTYDDNIMVNIPAFSLVYYSDGKEILSSRVIVGRPDRKTPLMSNALTNVVINPPWNVPTKLAREDIVPKAKRDPEYLKRQGYTVYSGWGRNAERVDVDNVDWSTVSPNSLRFEQAPGGGNSLGRYKFNMPNSQAIYLHDTPNHSSFNKSYRALSSGCIRVNESEKLINLLLEENDGWNGDRIRKTVQGRKTTHVNLLEKVPVQLYYMTAWNHKDQAPQFRNDVYNYDAMSKRALTEIEFIKLLVN